MIKSIIKLILDYLHIIKVSFLEFHRSLHKSKKNKLEAMMLVNAHSLEKGFSVKNPRKGFGQVKAIKLSNLIIKYAKKYDYNIYPIFESYGILNYYMSYLKSIDISNDVLTNNFDIIKRKIGSTDDRYKCGIEMFNFEHNCDYSSVVLNRHSIRNFKNEDINIRDFEEAVKLANCSPSACNRQPQKVYAVFNNIISSKFSKLLCGNKTITDNVNNFLVITVDRSYFYGNEEYQWYVNGGIYVDSLVNALFYKKIGSCIMQWFAFGTNEKKIKRLLNISKHEAIICVIAIGYPDDNITRICAQRKQISDTIIYK